MTYYYTIIEYMMLYLHDDVGYYHDDMDVLHDDTIILWLIRQKKENPRSGKGTLSYSPPAHKDFRSSHKEK